MKIYVELACVRPAVLVTFLVENACSLAVGFSHKVVLALAAYTQSFGSTGVIPVPSLSSAVNSVRHFSFGIRYRSLESSLTSARICFSNFHA